MAARRRAAQVRPEDLGIGRLFWSIDEPVVVVDLAAERIVLWNPAAERLLGYTAAEALAAPLEALFPERLREQYRARRIGSARPGSRCSRRDRSSCQPCARTAGRSSSTSR